MPPSLDGIVTAVVERLQSLEQARQIMALKQRRRSPRPYTKKLKESSRTVPTVALPSGPLPDEPWYDPHEDEAEVPLIGEAILAYEKEHMHRARMTAYQSERAIASFLTASELHENEPIWCITREACKRWRTVLMDGTQHLPVPRNKRKPGPVTIEKRLKMVAHFLSWCVDREYLPANPMQGLSLPKRLVAASKQRKTSFSEVELQQIITALLAMPVKPVDGETSDRDHEVSEDLPRIEFKWCALALLFSGARCMEILQLRHKDVRQVEGYWVFDIQATDTDNRVKNHPSIRLLPIHSQLIELGFLEWIAAQKKEKKSTSDARVFPLIHPKGSPLVSMWFSRVLSALQIKRPEVSLHSLRHTMTVLLAHARTYPPLQNRLLGHAIGKSVEDRVYLAGLTFTVKELSEALEKVRFPINTK